MPNPHARSVDPSLLHPSFRTKAQQVLDALHRSGAPFQIFEAYRTPDRQADLYAQGRTAPGSIVTKAQPWQSYHQYGLGADFVLQIDGKWSWDTSSAKTQAWWDLLKKTGAQFGLESLSFEIPHLQLAGVDLAQLRAGNYPSGGDDSWADNLHATILSWKGSPAAPVAPATAQRPPLPSE